jgi:hypothetical protein
MSITAIAGDSRLGLHLSRLSYNLVGAYSALDPEREQWCAH